MTSNCFRQVVVSCTFFQGSSIPARSAPACQTVSGIAVFAECAQWQRIRSCVARARAVLGTTSRVIQATHSATAFARIAGTAQNLVAIREPMPDEPAVQALGVSKYEPVCFPITFRMIDGEVSRCPAAGADASVVTENSVSDNLGIAVLLLFRADPAPSAQAIRSYPAPIEPARCKLARPRVFRARTSFQICRLSHGRRVLLRQGPEAHGAGNTVSGPRDLSLVSLMSRYGGRL
jgi:hypothetical protein